MEHAFVVELELVQAVVVVCMQYMVLALEVRLELAVVELRDAFEQVDAVLDNSRLVVVEQMRVAQVEQQPVAVEEHS